VSRASPTSRPAFLSQQLYRQAAPEIVDAKPAADIGHATRQDFSAVAQCRSLLLHGLRIEPAINRRTSEFSLSPLEAGPHRRKKISNLNEKSLRFAPSGTVLET
jgi:hypothetical protein